MLIAYPTDKTATPLKRIVGWVLTDPEMECYDPAKVIKKPDI